MSKWSPALTNRLKPKNTWLSGFYWMVHQNEYFGYDSTRFVQFDIGLGRITIFLSILNFHPKYPIFVESPGEDDWMKRCKWLSLLGLLRHWSAPASHFTWLLVTQEIKNICFNNTKMWYYFCYMLAFIIWTESTLFSSEVYIWEEVHPLPLVLVRLNMLPNLYSCSNAFWPVKGVFCPFNFICIFFVSFLEFFLWKCYIDWKCQFTRKDDLK